MGDGLLVAGAKRVMKKEFYAEYFKIEDKHWWFVGRRNVCLRVLDKYLPWPTDGRERRILDLGCGTGTMLKYLSRYGRAQGVDMDEGAVQFCHERGVHDVHPRLRREQQRGHLPAGGIVRVEMDRETNLPA